MAVSGTGLRLQDIEAQPRCTHILTERIAVARLVPAGIGFLSGARHGRGWWFPSSPSSSSSLSSAAAAEAPASLRSRLRACVDDGPRPRGGGAEAAAAAEPLNLSDIRRRRQLGIQSEAQASGTLAYVRGSGLLGSWSGSTCSAPYASPASSCAVVARIRSSSFMLLVRFRTHTRTYTDAISCAFLKRV